MVAVGALAAWYRNKGQAKVSRAVPEHLPVAVQPDTG
jgi:hypothetical protein